MKKPQDETLVAKINAALELATYEQDKKDKQFEELRQAAIKFLISQIASRIRGE